MYMEITDRMIILYVTVLMIGSFIMGVAFTYSAMRQDLKEEPIGELFVGEGVNGVTQPLVHCYWEEQKGCHMTYLTGGADLLSNKG